MVNALLIAQRTGDALPGRVEVLAQRAVRAAALPALSALCRRLCQILQHALGVARIIAQREGNAALVGSCSGQGMSHHCDQGARGGPDGTPSVTMPFRTGLIAECDVLVLKLTADSEDSIRTAFEKVLSAVAITAPQAHASDGETSAAPFPGPVVFGFDNRDSSSRRGRMEEGGDDGSSLIVSSVGSTPGRRNGSCRIV